MPQSTQSQNGSTAQQVLAFATNTWGINPTLEHLKHMVVRNSVIADLSSPDDRQLVQLSKLAGGEVIVFGLNDEEDLLPELQYTAGNITFKPGSTSRDLPFDNDSVDVVTSFFATDYLMNMPMRGLFWEMSRILKPGGHAVLLMLHPRFVSGSWNLSFMRFSPESFENFWCSRVDEREDVRLDCHLTSTFGDIKRWQNAWHHTADNIKAAFTRTHLRLKDFIPLEMDAARARKLYGDDSVGKMPTTPVYQILVLRKY